MSGEMNGNPYVGPRSFSVEQRKYFYGRKGEIAILEGMALSRRTSLFFAPSGAGKSSLLRAGLIPELTREEKIGRGPETQTIQKMHVLPILTVSSGIPGGMKEQIDNIFVFAALVNLYPPDAECDDLAPVTFREGLAPYLHPDAQESAGSAGGAAPTEADWLARPPTLLIFDQFEELFTLYPDRWKERESFFQQINEALVEYPDLHVLFSMREDFIAELTPYAHLLPHGLRDRFRMELLQPNAALQAVTEPAREAGRMFAEGIAEDLVDNLRRSQPGRQHATAKPDAEPTLGPYVEPVHLQIVCRQLWSQLPADQKMIEADDVQTFGDVDQALIDFYEATLKEVFSTLSAHPDLSERVMRGWFDDQLITPARTRDLVYRGETETAGLLNAAVDVLSEAYIVRARVRGPDTWHQLAHDRLVEPILAANRRWRDQVGQVLTDAEQWLAEKREQQYLYEGRQLKKELAALQREGAVPLVQEFLEEGKKYVRRRRLRWIASITITVVAILVVLFIVGEQQFQKVRQATRMTVLYSGENLLVTEPEFFDSGSPIYMFSLAGDQPQFSRSLEGHTDEIYSAAISNDERYMASVSWDGTLRIWDLVNPEDPVETDIFEDPDLVDLTAVAFSPSGDYIAWGNRDGFVDVYDFAAGDQFTLPQHEGLIHTLSFSPDERFLFVIADSDPEFIYYYAISDLAALDPDGEPTFLDLPDSGN